MLRDTSAVLLCKSVSVNTVGDHSVWYGKVLHAYTNGAVLEPLLYYAKLVCLCSFWQFKVIITVENFLFHCCSRNIFFIQALCL